MWAEFTGLIVFAGSLIYAAKPLVSGVTEPGESGETTDAMDERKLRIYEALNDLEYDREMQKVSTADYAALQKRLKREALEILAAASQQSRSSDRDNAEEKSSSHADPPLPADRLAVCSSCGNGVPANFQYCGQCGALMPAGCRERIA